MEKRLSDLSFPVDVSLPTGSIEDMERQLNTVNKGTLKRGLQIRKGKPKVMTDTNSTDNIQVDRTKKRMWLTISTHIRGKHWQWKTEQEMLVNIKVGWSVWGEV